MKEGNNMKKLMCYLKGSYCKSYEINVPVEQDINKLKEEYQNLGDENYQYYILDTTDMSEEDKKDYIFLED